MTASPEPDETDVDRAARIRKLRSGDERVQNYRDRRRERREQQVASSDVDTAGATSTDDAATNGETGGEREDDAAGDDATREDGVEGGASGDEPSVLSVPEEFPASTTAEAFYLDGRLARELRKSGEWLHLSYGFQYDAEIDPDHHFRPLVVYLGLQQVESLEVSELHEILVDADELVVPE